MSALLLVSGCRCPDFQQYTSLYLTQQNLVGPERAGRSCSFSAFQQYLSIKLDINRGFVAVYCWFQVIDSPISSILAAIYTRRLLANRPATLARMPFLG